MDALRDAVREDIMQGFPYVADPDTSEPLAGVVEPSVGWGYLETIHDIFVNRIPVVVSRRGSAEWLWWLRRLRGQRSLGGQGQGGIGGLSGTPRADV